MGLASTSRVTKRQRHCEALEFALPHSCRRAGDLAPLPLLEFMLPWPPLACVCASVAIMTRAIGPLFPLQSKRSWMPAT